jgi:type II secretory pathway component PulF
MNENIANVFKFIGILCLALALTEVVAILATPDKAVETLQFSGILLLWTIGSLIGIVWYVVFLFWPILFYFWASLKSSRQWTLLSLLQTSIETGKPLQNIVRAYATGCPAWYAARLNRFARALESGYSLDAAIREFRGLFRYDIAGMIRLGDSPETLRFLGTVVQDERDFSAIRTYNVIRIIYLCTMVSWLALVMTFFFTKIIPEFEKIFQDFSAQLPPLTKSVIAMGNAAGEYWYLAAPFMLLCVLAAFAYMILLTNAVLFRPFGFRCIFRSTDSAKFLRVFAVGVRHHFPIPAIVERYCWAVPSDYLRQKGLAIRKRVERGEGWIEAFNRVGFVSRPEASLLQSAERTGNTAAVLDQLAQTKERLQIRQDDLFSKLVFIPLVFLLGAIIGTFVIAMFMPLVTLITTLSTGSW